MVLQWCTNFSIIFSKIKSARLIICYHTENTRLIIWTNVVTILLDRGISERWTDRIAAALYFMDLSFSASSDGWTVLQRWFWPVVLSFSFWRLYKFENESFHRWSFHYVPGIIETVRFVRTQNAVCRWKMKVVRRHRMTQRFENAGCLLRRLVKRRGGKSSDIPGWFSSENLN